MEFSPASPEGLFSNLKPQHSSAAQSLPAVRAHMTIGTLESFAPEIGERTLDLFDRAEDPTDPLELRDLYLGRVECECRGGDSADRRALAWRASKRRRSLTEQHVLNSRTSIRFVKELFNAYFRDDLYGRFRSSETILLSSGSVCEASFGLPEAIKACLDFALRRDWYGYSDSRGRWPARDAVAAYETARLNGACYTAEHIAINLGATAAISALADFFLSGVGLVGKPALCAIPNYPPLVESVARRHSVQQVPLVSNNGHMGLGPLLAALTPSTPLVLLQTVANPTGVAVDEAELAKLIRAASPSTIIMLDECHEFLGEPLARARERAAKNVVRITSMSKTWSVPGMKVGWIIASPAVIDEFYEFASTTYGGPPSFFYSLVEVATRMERWILESRDSPGPAELAEFEPSYGLTQDALKHAFACYRNDRIQREQTLIANRVAFITALRDCGYDVLTPTHSINAVMSYSSCTDSYVTFRNLLKQTGVSVFPTALMFGYDSHGVRITTSRSARDLSHAIDRLAK